MPSRDVVYVKCINALDKAMECVALLERNGVLDDNEQID